MDVLKERIGSDKTNQLLKACIGQEHHADGGLHLHVCAWYTHELRFTDSRYLDLPGDEGATYHPNIKDTRIKRKKAALQYCSKEAPEPLQFNMDIKEEAAARQDHRKILTKRIIEGAPLHKLIDDGELNLIDLPKWKQGLDLYRRLKGEEKPDLPDILPNPFDLIIHSDLQQKKRHYWIWSKQPNRGKTTGFLEPLEENH